MRIVAHKDGNRTTLLVGQQNIDIVIPRGGVVEFTRASQNGAVLAQHYQALVRNETGSATQVYTLDERDVRRPASSMREL